MLWYGPFALLLLGGGVLVYQLRKRRKAVPEANFRKKRNSGRSIAQRRKKYKHDFILDNHALLAVVAVLFVVLPLWRKGATTNEVVRDAANLEILRDQSAEMEVDLRNGLLTQETYDQGKRELQSRLLEEVKMPISRLGNAQSAKVLAIVLGVALPVLAMGLYWKMGNRDALLPPGSLDAAKHDDFLDCGRGDQGA